VDTSTERFDRVTAHPDYAATSQRSIQLPDDHAYILIARGGWALVGLFITIVWIVMVFAMGDLMPWPIRIVVALFGVVFGLVWIGTSFGAARLALTYHRAPIVPLVAVIVRDRSEVAGGDENTRAYTSYYATLQSRDGKRAEYTVSSRIAGKLVVGDIGVAYVKQHTLVDFVHFDV
jgi:uncharacterized protein DUF2500